MALSGSAQIILAFIGIAAGLAGFSWFVSRAVRAQAARASGPWQTGGDFVFTSGEIGGHAGGHSDHSCASIDAGSCDAGGSH